MYKYKMVATGEIVFNKSKPEIMPHVIKNNLNQKIIQQPQNTEEQKMDDLVDQSNRMLIKVSSIFPFDIFPDDLIINENKITVVIREFFASEQIFSIPIKDISDVIVETNIFFGTIKVTDRNFPYKPIVVKFLDRDKAIKARTIIQGLILSQSQGIDFSKIRSDHLVKKIEELGKTSFSI